MCALQRSYLEYFSIRKKVIVLLSHCIRFVGDAQRAFGAGHDSAEASINSSPRTFAPRSPKIYRPISRMARFCQCNTYGLFGGNPRRSLPPSLKLRRTSRSLGMTAACAAYRGGGSAVSRRSVEPKPPTRWPPMGNSGKRQSKFNASWATRSPGVIVNGSLPALNNKTQISSG